MTSQTETHTLAAPSLSKLARTTGLALLLAGVLLITIVLPAEYAIDPIGTGRWLGLTQIAAPAVSVVEPVNAEGAPLAPIGEYPREFKYDVFEIELGAYEYVEYKYQMAKGATMLFSWTANLGVLHDLHAERAQDSATGGPAEESFDKSSRQQATASYTAPFTGIHGWYWENPGAARVRIRLTSAGFYESAVEIRSDRTRQTHPLRALESLPAPPRQQTRTETSEGTIAVP
jgi:hypothetical protein